MEEVKPTNRQFALACVGLIFILTFLNWITVNFVEEFFSFFASVNEKREVEPTSAVALPMLVGCLAINFLFLVLIIKIVTKEKHSLFLKKWAKRLVMLCFLSIGLHLTNPLVHYGLNQYAKKNGYFVCPNKNAWKWLMFRTQYVLDSSKCGRN